MEGPKFEPMHLAKSNQESQDLEYRSSFKGRMRGVHRQNGCDRKQSQTSPRALWIKSRRRDVARAKHSFLESTPFYDYDVESDEDNGLQYSECAERDWLALHSEAEYPFRERNSDALRDLGRLDENLVDLESGEQVREYISSLRFAIWVCRKLMAMQLELFSEHKALLKRFRLPVSQFERDIEYMRYTHLIDRIRDECLPELEEELAKVQEYWQLPATQNEYRDRLQKFIYGQRKYYKKRRLSRNSGNRQLTLQSQVADLRELQQQAHNRIQNSPQLQSLFKMVR